MLTPALDEQASISEEIEDMREQMVSLGNQFGFMHPEVQHCSRQLDQLLLRYYEAEKTDSRK
ncbi:Spo0E family sporulation regulatory protein-aspartic acid phosphatase [Paenibacillus elgii]